MIMDNYNNINLEYGYELVRPYINRQVYTNSYDSRKSLKRGTLFPELDLIKSNHYNAWLYANPNNRVKDQKGDKK